MNDGCDGERAWNMGGIDCLYGAGEQQASRYVMIERLDSNFGAGGYGGKLFFDCAPTEKVLQHRF